MSKESFVLQSGVVDDPEKIKDFVFDKVKKHLKKEEALGAIQIQHFGRFEKVKQDKIYDPPIYQGQLNACVCCSIVEAMQYLHFKNTGLKIQLDWRDLYDRAPKYDGGTKPSEVLELARKEGVKEVGTGIVHKLDAWSRIINPTPEKIAEAMALGGEVIMGVDTKEAQLAFGSYAHEIKNEDFNVVANRFQIVNHWSEDTQRFDDIPMNIKLINCIVLHDKPDVPKDKVRLGRTGIFTNYFKKILKTLIL